MNGEGFHCIAADPPWKERGGGKIKRGADRHYPLLDRHEIVEVMLKSPLWQLAPDCHLWLWGTTNHLKDALWVGDALGFRHIRAVPWLKADIAAEVAGRKPWFELQAGGLGQYVRGIHEDLHLFAKVGGKKLKAPGKLPLGVIIAPRGKHSEKPQAAYDLIEQVSPGPRAELFAREMRDGWNCWGRNERGEQWGTGAMWFEIQQAEAERDDVAPLDDGTPQPEEQG